MDKEKEIEEMATVLPKLIVCDGGYGWDDEQEVDCWETARNLINAGYGNIEQAVKEFAEKLKRAIIEGDGTCLDDYDIGKQDGYNMACKVHREKIDQLVKEYNNDD